MQLDFHYHATAVLANSAGFSRDDSLTIGLASQYVDDCTSGRIRTAHVGLESWDAQVQREVYQAFHFLPQAPDNPVVAPARGCSLDLLRAALEETDSELRIYRVGIACHSLADTYAHQGFSGRENSENDVDDPWIFNGGQWRRASPFEYLGSVVLPKIGHSQAGNLPDYPWLLWRFRNAAGEIITRDNRTIANQAAKTLERELMPHWRIAQLTDFREFDSEIFTLLGTEGDVTRRCQTWAGHWPYLFSGYEYDKKRIDYRLFTAAAILQRDAVLQYLAKGL